MDAIRFAELVQSLHEAGQIARGQRKPLSSSANPHVGSDFEDFLAEEGWLPETNITQPEIERLCEQVVGFFEGEPGRVVVSAAESAARRSLAAGHDLVRALRQVATVRG